MFRSFVILVFFYLQLVLTQLAYLKIEFKNVNLHFILFKINASSMDSQMQEFVLLL